MTVKELIEELQKFRQGDEVWFARDEEGNTYHKSADVQRVDLSLTKDKHVVVAIYPLNSNEDIT